MKKTLLKKILREESRIFVPDLKDKILAQIPIQKEKIGKPSISFNRAWSFGLATLLIVFAGITYFGLNKSTPTVFTNTIVSIDINPSLELETDVHDVVVSYRSMNVDAQLLMEEEGLNLVNKSVDEAIEIFVELAIEYGYLEAEDVDAEVFIAAINQDSTFEEALNTRLQAKVEIIKQQKNLQGKIVLASADSETKELAKANQVSVGKMLLIEKAQAQNASLTIEQAKMLNVKQLNEISRGYDGQKITEFANAYRGKVEELNEKKDSAIVSLENQKQIILNEISDILEMIENNESLASVETRVNNLLATYFPNVHPENLTNYARYAAFLNGLNHYMETKTVRIEGSIKAKFESQVKAFRFQMPDDIQNNEINFDFVFDDDFEIGELPNGDLPTYNETEAKIFDIINQVLTYIDVIEKNPNAHYSRIERAIDVLMNQYEALMQSPQVSSAFKQSDLIVNFTTSYQAYLEK